MNIPQQATLADAVEMTPETEIPIRRGDALMRADEHYARARKLVAKAVTSAAENPGAAEVAAVLIGAASVEAQLAALCYGKGLL
jgi:sulfate adenylyltransferase subunit 1 (EFTu-like GTPase family)